MGAPLPLSNSSRLFFAVPVWVPSLNVTAQLPVLVVPLPTIPYHATTPPPIKQATHAGTNQTKYSCEHPGCVKVFAGEASLKRHGWVHKPEEEYPFPCGKCKRRFYTKQSIGHHERTHSQSKIDQCAKYRLSPYHSTTPPPIKEATQDETNQTEYACEYPGCSKAFAREYSLKRHVWVHKSKEERPFPCGVCEKRFYTKQGLNRHVRIHSQSKIYQCAKCKMSFTDPSNLRRHHKVHVHMKGWDFRCEKCDKYFKRKATLDTHMFRHKETIA